MDAFTIEVVAEELAGRVTGARIDKIHQPEAATILLRLWGRGEEMRLLLSATPGRARCHLTATSFANPPAPPRFCQLLRARLSVVTRFEQVPGERIVRVECRGREGKKYALMVELLGAHPDLVLVDDAGIIVDALRREGGGGRDNLPGRVYHFPRSPQRIALDLAERNVPPEVTSDATFEQWLRASVAPMSPIVARDLAAGLRGGEAHTEVLERFRQRRQDRQCRPAIVVIDGKSFLTPFIPRHLPLDSLQAFPSMSEAADAFYRLLREDANSERQHLSSAVRKQRQRIESRRQRIEADSKAVAEREDCHFGDLLMANLHLVRPGMTGITLDNLFQQPPEPVFIPLDSRLNAVENAQRYFLRQRKDRKGREHAERRRAETEEECEWLEGAALALDEAESPAELEAIRRELEEAGVIAVPAGRSRRRPAPIAGICRATTPGGFQLFWGKTNLANDRVSREFTRPEDLWFHAKGIPGSHLVLQRQGWKGTIPEADVLYAAALAAGYSRGKGAASVEVMVAEGKHVRRIKGGRPGLVTVGHFRTVMVPPRRLTSTVE